MNPYASAPPPPEQAHVGNGDILPGIMLEIQDLGWFTLRINDMEQRLDLWRFNNRLAAFAEEYQGKPTGEYWDAVCAYLNELGFPGVSHYGAWQMIEQLNPAVAALKKKSAPAIEPSSDLPDSMPAA